MILKEKAEEDGRIQPLLCREKEDSWRGEGTCLQQSYIRQ